MLGLASGRSLLSVFSCRFSVQSRSSEDSQTTDNRQPTTSALSAAGFTIAELVTVCAIIAILAAMALPVARFGIRRQKEMDLRDRLRMITESIDR